LHKDAFAKEFGTGFTRRTYKAVQAEEDNENNTRMFAPPGSFTADMQVKPAYVYDFTTIMIRKWDSFSISTPSEDDRVLGQIHGPPGTPKTSDSSSSSSGVEEEELNDALTCRSSDNKLPSYFGKSSPGVLIQNALIGKKIAHPFFPEKRDIFWQKLPVCILPNFCRRVLKL
jgi:hypothetical protein